MSLKGIPQQRVAYHERLERRDLKTITTVVIHCTELPDLAMARDYAQKVLYESGTGACGHLYVDRDGRVVQYVALDRIAHHVRGHNRSTVGIELVNRGRYPDWFDSRSQTPTEAYAADQIDALIGLLAKLRRRLPSLCAIQGHDDLDVDRVEASDDPTRTVRRKIDPGPLFPWPRVLESSGLIRGPIEAVGQP